MFDTLDSLKDKLKGVFLSKVSLAKYNTWRIGGSADYYFIPKNKQSLTDCLNFLPKDTPVTYLGLGSNVLIRDGGIRGLVIHTAKMEDEILCLDRNLFYFSAGVSCAKIAKFCANEGMTSGLFFAGIPGTIGGALAMNAGAFGGETWSQVEAVETMDRNGVLRIRYPKDFAIGYRHVDGPADEWFIGGYLRFQEESIGSIESAKLGIQTLLKKRKATQPIGLPSCGSVFKNPLGYYAAQLIQGSRLKGKVKGGAYVSSKHANFIITEAGAKSSDIESLIHEIIDTVEKQHQIKLVPEVRLLGEEKS